MNKTLLKITGALLLVLGITTASIATPVNGSITFKGGITIDTDNVGTATQVSSWVTPSVQSVSGDFATFVSNNDQVTMNAPWSFNSAAINNFWSVGGFNFDLISSSIVVQGVFGSFGYVVVNGEGTISGNNFDSYVGSWSFSSQTPAGDGGVFSFSGGSSVPDSGTTALLLGSALVGMSVIARRRKAV